MAARNAPCPCGSGRKHKLCCGMTRVEEIELVRQAGVLAEVAALPLEFPGLRPEGRRFSPDREVLALLEESDDLRWDDSESLSFALEPRGLWSACESIQVEEALDAIPAELDDDAYGIEWERIISAQAARLATPWHDERLKLLVSRLEAHLPVAEHQRASSVLLAACAAFGRDEAIRRRVAELLLVGSLSWADTELPLAA